MIQVGKHKLKIEQWQLDYIKSHWDEKNSKIAEATGLTEKRVSQVGMLIQLPKKATGYNKTEGITVAGHHYKNFTQEMVDYIKAHYHEPTVQIAEYLKVNPQRVSDIILGLGLRGPLWQRLLPRTPEVDEDLKNPYLTHVELGKKYGVDETTIAARRRELGVGVRRKNFDTLIEKRVQEILDRFDLAYIPQKVIDGWSIDFYLGCKHCIDVNGTWAHSKPDVIQRDQNKKEYLSEHGYKYLVIEEEELEDIDTVTFKINEFTKGFPYA